MKPTIDLTLNRDFTRFNQANSHGMRFRNGSSLMVGAQRAMRGVVFPWPKKSRVNHHDASKSTGTVRRLNGTHVPKQHAQNMKICAICGGVEIYPYAFQWSCETCGDEYEVSFGAYAFDYADHVMYAKKYKPYAKAHQKRDRHTYSMTKRLEERNTEANKALQSLRMMRRQQVQNDPF